MSCDEKTALKFYVVHEAAHWPVTLAHFTLTDCLVRITQISAGNVKLSAHVCSLALVKKNARTRVCFCVKRTTSLKVFSKTGTGSASGRNRIFFQKVKRRFTKRSMKRIDRNSISRIQSFCFLFRIRTSEEFTNARCSRNRDSRKLVLYLQWRRSQEVYKYVRRASPW